MKPSLVAAGAVAASAVLALASLGAYAQAKKWYPFTVEEHDPGQGSEVLAARESG